MSRKYDTALRPHLQKRLEEIREADILIGIPCFNNEDTIEHVLRMVSHGLFEHYRNLRAAVLIADGGSTDDTRDRVKDFEIRPWQEKAVTIYRGIGGKGTALRAIFEAAHKLKVRAAACVDSDLRSISPDWVKYLLDPVLEGGFEFVAPVYSRFKYDGTITNNIVYSLVRALYGRRIRQPIGGDFAFSRRLAAHYLDQDVWDSDIARFGIDIWMTLSAVVEDARLCQSNLGVKIHAAKDPAESLGPMFRQVCGTFFQLMERHEDFWKPIRGSKPVPTFGTDREMEPDPVEVNQARMVREFREGFRLFGPLYREIFTDEVYASLSDAAGLEPEEFGFPVDTWVKLVYELAGKYHHLTEHRGKLLTLMTPLYLGRVASFINATWDLNAGEAEEAVDRQTEIFEEHKDYLIESCWDGPAPRDLHRLLAREG